jgi:exoribonuclease-2
MSRVELVPLHLPIPELASHPRMTRAEVVVADIDLLQLSASVRVLEIEAKIEPAEKATEVLTDTLSEDPQQDVSPD